MPIAPRKPPRPDASGARITLVNVMAGTLYYDGDCPFCTRSTLRWAGMTGGRLVAFPFRERPDLFPETREGKTPGGVCYLGRDGILLKGAEATVAAWRDGGPLRPFAALVCRLPGFMPVARWLYGRVAANRWRFSGADCQGGACLPRGGAR